MNAVVVLTLGHVPAVVVLPQNPGVALQHLVQQVHAPVPEVTAAIRRLSGFNEVNFEGSHTFYPGKSPFFHCNFSIVSCVLQKKYWLANNWQIFYLTIIRKALKKKSCQSKKKYWKTFFLISLPIQVQCSMLAVSVYAV